MRHHLRDNWMKAMREVRARQKSQVSKIIISSQRQIHAKFVKSSVSVFQQKICFSKIFQVESIRLPLKVSRIAATCFSLITIRVLGPFKGKPEELDTQLNFSLGKGQKGWRVFLRLHTACQLALIH